MEQNNILIEDAKIGALIKEIKEAEIKMEKAFISYQSYLTDHMVKRDYIEYRTRIQNKNMTCPHPIQTECPIEFSRVVTIMKVFYNNDDIYHVDDDISCL